MYTERERGVTLVELILFMVIVGIALGGIVTVMNFTSEHSADPVRRKQALIIAEGLLEEVELAQFSYCDPSDPNAGDPTQITGSNKCTVPEAFGQASPEPVNSRPYDNVNDYVSTPGTLTAAFNDANGNLVDANGNALGVTGYTARVSVTPATLGGVSGGGTMSGNAADTDVLRITIEVDYDANQSVTLEGYRMRYAPTIQGTP